MKQEFSIALQVSATGSKASKSNEWPGAGANTVLINVQYLSNSVAVKRGQTLWAAGDGD